MDYEELAEKNIMRDYMMKLLLYELLFSGLLSISIFKYLSGFIVISNFICRISKFEIIDFVFWI